MRSLQPSNISLVLLALTDFQSVFIVVLFSYKGTTFIAEMIWDEERNWKKKKPLSCEGMQDKGWKGPALLWKSQNVLLSFNELMLFLSQTVKGACSSSHAWTNPNDRFWSLIYSYNLNRTYRCSRLPLCWWAASSLLIKTRCAKPHNQWVLSHLIFCVLHYTPCVTSSCRQSAGVCVCRR